MHVKVAPLPLQPDAEMNNVFLNALFITSVDLDRDGFLLLLEDILPANVSASVKSAKDGFVLTIAGVRSPVIIDMRIRELEISLRKALVPTHASGVERCFCEEDGLVLLAADLDQPKEEQDDGGSEAGESAGKENIVDSLKTTSIKASNGSNPFDLLSGDE